MRKFLITASLILSALSLSAQTSNVSGTVEDTDGTFWAAGSWKVVFQPGPSDPNIQDYNINGTPLSPSVLNQSGALTAGGSPGQFTFTVYQNGVVSPAGSFWLLTLCPNASSACGTFSFTANTSTLVISSSLITNSIPVPRFQAKANSYGYADIEAITQNTAGSTYWNVTSGVQRCYNNMTPAWGVCSAGGSFTPAGDLGGSSSSQTVLGLTHVNNATIPVAVSAPNLSPGANAYGAGNFTPSVNNPLNATGINTQAYIEVESNGTCENIFTRAASQTWYSTATDPYCEQWTTPVLVSSLTSYYIPSFGIFKSGSTYYMIANVSSTAGYPAGGAGKLYLFSATSLSGTWTLQNGGSPVFTASATSTNIDYYLYNPSITILSSGTWWLTVDVGNGAQGQMTSYATGCPSSCNFNTNQSSHTVYVLPVGSPQLLYVPDNTAVVMLAYDNSPTSAGYNGLTAYIIASSADPTVATNWTRAPGFLMWYPANRLSTGYLSDARLYFSPTASLKAWNAILSYDQNQNVSAQINQAYSQLTLDQWYTAISNPIGQVSPYINMPTIVGPYVSFSNPVNQGLDLYYSAGLTASSTVTRHFQSYLGTDIFKEAFTPSATAGQSSYQFEDPANGMTEIGIQQGLTTLNASTSTGAVRINSNGIGGGTVGNTFQVLNGNAASQFTVDYRGDINSTGLANVFADGSDNNMNFYFQPGLTSAHNMSFVWNNYAGTVEWQQNVDTTYDWVVQDKSDSVNRIYMVQGADTVINAAGSGNIRFQNSGYGGSGTGTGFVYFYGGGSSPQLAIDNKGAVIPKVLYSAAGTALPTCNSAYQGAELTVSDATTPLYMTTYTSGGGITAEVICSYNGTTYSWLTH